VPGRGRRRQAGACWHLWGAGGCATLWQAGIRGPTDVRIYEGPAAGWIASYRRRMKFRRASLLWRTGHASVVRTQEPHTGPKAGPRTRRMSS